MRIAQIAPLAESVPPRFYGGTERAVSYLTEELVRQGHEVTLFASGGSRTRARLCAITPRALRLDPEVRDPLPHHLILMEEVKKRAREFDVLHFHSDLLHFPLLDRLGTPAVTTLHGRLDLPDLGPFFRAFGGHALVSISHSQRAPVPDARWVATVPHGLPADLLPFRPRPAADGHLAFLGRISPEKRPDRAIAIAARAGRRLRIAAKVDNADFAYWREEIRPLVRSSDVEFLGEIGEADKAAFLGEATALLFPIDWPEPFGIVMIEAMACGTPVIAWPRGAAPEVVEQGVTGFLVESLEAATAAVGAAARLDRAAVRAGFERRFRIERVAADYLRVYRQLSGAPPLGALPLTA